jgi:hypothetical protein
MTRFDLSKTYYPSTATLEEAQGVVAKLREMLTYSSGERAAELREDLATWERVARERTEGEKPQ